MVEIANFAVKWKYSCEGRYSAAAYKNGLLVLGYLNGKIDVTTTFPPSSENITTIDTKCDRIYFLEILESSNGPIIIGADQCTLFAMKDNQVYARREFGCIQSISLGKTNSNLNLVQVCEGTSVLTLDTNLQKISAFSPGAQKFPESYPLCVSTGEITTRDSLGIQTVAISDSQSTVSLCQISNGRIYSKVEIPETITKIAFSPLIDSNKLKSLYVASGNSLFTVSTEKALLSDIWNFSAKINDFLILPNRKFFVSTDDGNLYLLKDDKEIQKSFKSKVRKLLFKGEDSLMVLFENGDLKYVQMT